MNKSLFSILFFLSSSFVCGQENPQTNGLFLSYFHADIPKLSGNQAEELLWKMIHVGQFYSVRRRGYGRDAGDSGCSFSLQVGDVRCTLSEVINVISGNEQPCSYGQNPLTREQFTEIFLHVPPDQKVKSEYFFCEYHGPFQGKRLDQLSGAP